MLLCAILPSIPLEDFAVEQSLESGPPLAGLSLCAILSFKLCAGLGRSLVPLCFAGECSLDAGPLLALISTCSKLCAFLSAGPGWKSTPLESAGECSPELESPLAGWETSLYESVTF